MKSWAKVVQDALYWYASGKIVYLYGTCNEIGTDELVERNWALYPEHFKQYVTDRGHTKQELKDHVRGKICCDCSGFVSLCLGLKMHYTSPVLRSRFVKTTTPALGVYGSVLYRAGHVGIDTTCGTVVECTSEFNDLKLNLIRERDFTESGEIWYVDYTGANNL